MRTISPTRWLHAVIVVLALALASCGGGTTTAGSGGSGVGGTGVTRVSGNVTQVVGLAPELERRGAGTSLFASIASWVSRPATAQTGSLAGIRVSGGGRSTTTDFRGDFELVGVDPSADFTLTFETEDSPPIVLPVGAVSQGSDVRVRDVVLDTQRGVAQAAAIEIRENPNGPEGDGACSPDNPGQGNPGSQGQGNPCPPGPGGQNPGQGNPGQGDPGQDNQGQGNQGEGQDNQGQDQDTQGQGQGTQGQSS